MPVTSDFKGRLANRISSTWLENLGVDAAPLTGVTRAITDVDGPNSAVSIGLMVENSKGRTAQTLQKGTRGNAQPNNEDVSDVLYREYSDYSDPGLVSDPADYGKPNWSNFVIFPEFIEEGYQAFKEAELENLDDQNFIMNILREPLLEAVRQRIMLRFFQKLLRPYFFVDAAGSTESGSGANKALALKLNALITDYDEFGVGTIGTLYTDVRKRLLNKTGTLTCTLTPDLYNSITVASDNLNWANYSTNLVALQTRKIMQIKNVNFFESDLIDANQDIQQGGLSWTNAGDAAPGAGAELPRPRGVANKSRGTSGALTYATVPAGSNGATPKAPTTSMNIIGAAYNDRAVGMGIWRRWDAGRFAGNSLGVSTSFFSDPLTGCQFRIKIYYIPEKEEYRITCSAKVGFVSMDPRAATLILKDA